MREKIVDMAGTVEDTDHVDTSLVRQVEEEVVLEAFDWKPAKAFQARNAGSLTRAWDRDRMRNTSFQSPFGMTLPLP